MNNERGHPQHELEHLEAERRYRYERWRASEHTAEQRLTTAIAALTVSLSVLALSSSEDIQDLRPAIVYLLNSAICFGTSLRLIRSRKSIIREVTFLTRIRKDEMRYLPESIKPTYQAINSLDSTPPATFRLLSLPTGAASGGALLLGMAIWVLAGPDQRGRIILSLAVPLVLLVNFMAFYNRSGRAHDRALGEIDVR